MEHGRETIVCSELQCISMMKYLVHNFSTPVRLLLSVSSDLCSRSAAFTGF